MCTYCGTAKYRQIYENHYGPIPVDPEGRTYEIHHIDGDHSNNKPDNLKLVTIQEHYNIHYSQGDYGACLIMSDRMKISPEEKSKLARKSVQTQIENGKNVFTSSEWQRSNQIKLVNNGKHHMLGGKIQSSAQKKLLKEGRQNFKKAGFISSSQIRISCLCCRRNIGLSGFSQHLTKCSP